jgi:hypothetical protein
MMLVVLATGCMHEKKLQTQPPPVAAVPETQKPSQAKPPASTSKAKPPASTSKAKPAPATTAQTAPPTTTRAKTAAAPAKAQAASQTPKATTPKLQPGSPAATRPPAKATLDLDALKTRLKDTTAIGLMTKLSLKNKVDDLLDEFRKHYAGKPMPTMAQLRSTYDMLMMKVLSLLQDKDQQLASDILSSRERIWGLLADPKSFAALEAE